MGGTLKFNIAETPALPDGFVKSPNSANQASYDIQGTSLTPGTAYNIELGLSDGNAAADNGSPNNEGGQVSLKVCTCKYVF